MKKIILIIVLILVAGVLAFFYLGEKRDKFSSFSLGEIPVPDTPINKTCLKISKPDDLYYCLAVANQEPSYCNDLDLVEQRKLCQGMAARDISYCREIKKSEPRKMCYYELGFLVGEFDYCDETEDPNDCYDAFVHRLHWESRADEIKTEYCEKIDESVTGGRVLKKCCQAFQKQAPALCEGNRFCLSYFEQPMSFCDTKFITPSGRYKNKGDCLMDRAMSMKDASICAKIEEEEVRDLCYGNFSTHISPDLSLCNNIIDEMARNMCYAEYAINLSNK